jgi:hypothetical protein
VSAAFSQGEPLRLGLETMGLARCISTLASEPGRGSTFTVELAVG